MTSARRVVQITLDENAYWVLCNDGTLWWANDLTVTFPEWTRVPGPPGTVKEDSDES